MIKCFAKADAWPPEAEPFLEAVLGRLFDNPTLGFEFDGDEEEELPAFDSNTRPIARLGQLETMEYVERNWEKVRPRPLHPLR